MVGNKLEVFFIHLPFSAIIGNIYNIELAIVQAIVKLHQRVGEGLEPFQNISFSRYHPKCKNEHNIYTAK